MAKSDGQKSTPYVTFDHFWLYCTKLSAFIAPRRRQRPAEQKSQTASYGGAKSGLKYWRGWNFAAKTSVREAARGQILETVGLFRHTRQVRKSARLGWTLDPVGGQDCLADKACD